MRIPVSIYPSFIQLSHTHFYKFFDSTKQLTPAYNYANDILYKDTINISYENNSITIPILSSPYNKTIICLTTDDAKILKIQTPLNKLYDFHNACSVYIQKEQTSIFISQSTITPYHQLQISKSDAQLLGLRKNQIIKAIIPYKRTTISNIIVTIKDYYLPNLILRKDITNNLNIEHNDRANIIS